MFLRLLIRVVALLLLLSITAQACEPEIILPIEDDSDIVLVSNPLTDWTV